MKENYFGDEVDKALVEFQNCVDVKSKNKVFEKKIMPAFQKLISYYYFTMPVSRDDDILHDCLSFLFEQLNKFDASKKRGFPYFNVIVKNYFIQRLKQEKKKTVLNAYIFSLNDTFAEQNEEISVEDNIDVSIEKKEFIEIFKEYLIKWQQVFSKEQEKVVVDALVTLFENKDNIDIFNEKAIFHYLKEITGLNSTQISTNLNKIRKKFSFLNKKYERGDI